MVHKSNFWSQGEPPLTKPPQGCDRKLDVLGMTKKGPRSKQRSIIMSKYELEVNDALHFIAEGGYVRMEQKSVAYISRCVNASEAAVRRAWQLYNIVKDGQFYRGIGERKFVRL